MGQIRNFMHALPSADGTDAPTLGAIKRTLHALTLKTGEGSRRDVAAALREAHELLRQHALRSGVDPDIATQRSRAAVESQRERMAMAGAAASDPAQT